jgi:hypothetical protein
MRQEILDVAFSIAEHSNHQEPTADRIYRIVSQALGIAPSGTPYAGFRYAAGRDLRQAAWPKVYDLIVRLAFEFDHVGRFAEFQDGINQTLAGNGVVWDLSEDRRLVRVLPLTVQQQVSAAVQELSAPRYGLLFSYLMQRETLTTMDLGEIVTRVPMHSMRLNRLRKKRSRCRTRHLDRWLRRSET